MVSAAISQRLRPSRTPATTPPDLVGLLSTACLADPADVWSGLGRAVSALCGGEAAGVALSPATPSALGYPVLATRVGRARREVVWRDDATRGWCAAIKLTGEPEAGFLWVRGSEPPARDALRILRPVAGFATLLRAMEQRRERAELLLAESRHRAGNDLQLVRGLLIQQARSAGGGEIAAALDDVADRVAALAQARAAPTGDLLAGLRGLLAALGAQVRERGILLSLNVAGVDRPIDSRRVTALLIAVNELVTNAIKHGFPSGMTGRIEVAVRFHDHFVRVTVADDGWAAADGVGVGSGLDLLHRLITGLGGSFTPVAATKHFIIDLPLRHGGGRHRHGDQA